MTKTFEELVHEFEAEFKIEKKERDPVVDWLAQQKRTIFYYPANMSAHPLQKILHDLVPLEGREDHIFAKSMNFSYTLEHIWTSRNKEQEEQKAFMEWEQALHQKAKEHLLPPKNDYMYCAIYRFDDVDLEPTGTPMKFPKHQFYKKGMTYTSPNLKLHYRWFMRAPKDDEVIK
jgi:hypothetical protein